MNLNCFEKVLKRILYFVLIFLFFNECFLYSRPYVLVVSFDGFRFDYTDRCETPNFDSLVVNGVSAKSLIPVFPSLTFPNHYSIATGSYVNRHRLIANTFYDKKFKEKYSLRDRITVEDGKWYDAEPIWVTAEKQAMLTATYFWVGSEAEIKGYRPSIYKKYNSKISFEDRIDSVFTWFDLDYDKRPQLVMLYFNEPDHEGHVSGPESKETTKKIELSDFLLGKILDKISLSSIKDSLDLIVISDHGMTDVSKDRVVYVNHYIRGLYDMKFFNDGPFMQIDVKPNKSFRKNSIYRALKKIPNVSLFKKNEIPERFEFVNYNTGDFLLVANEGWFISMDSKLKVDFKLKGMHGYDPQLLNMQAIFYAYGPSFKKNYKIESFENIHIYPLLCKLLEIEPSEYIDGNIRYLNSVIK